jgi:histidinol-phosphatase (PHP family)
MLTLDYHLHSTHSKDGQNTVAEVCEAALERGLREVCFTEHVDFDRGDEAYGFLDWPAYAAAIAEARGRLGDRLVIRMGLEFDFRRAYGAEPGEVLAGMPCDFRLGSVHSAAGYHLWRLYQETEGLDVRAIQAEYLAEIEALVASGLATAIGHFDYLYKQLPALVGPYRDGGYWQRAEGILRQCVARGTALEVNTHHMLDRGLALAADVEVLRRYRALGGRWVTVGSDAHRRHEVAGNFAEAERALRAAGFEAVTGFEQGRPYSVNILQGKQKCLSA